MPPDEAVVPVHLLEVPVQVWGRAQQQADELFREFALAAASAEAEGTGGPHQLPARLTALIAALTSDFGGVADAQEELLFAAAAAGEEVIDRLSYQVPPAAGAASLALGDMMDEADDYCRAGQHLLTLAAPEEVVRFRRWYLSEFVRQVAGKEPTPWSHADGSWPPS